MKSKVNNKNVKDTWWINVSQLGQNLHILTIGDSALVQQNAWFMLNPSHEAC